MKLKNITSIPISADIAEANVNYIVINNVSEVSNDTVFVCVKGITNDGHELAEKALSAGAVCIVTERDLGLPHQVIVDDTRAEYAHMCAAFYGNPAEKLKIIGITGTNGKTTCTYLLKMLLEKNGAKVGLIGSIQNMICEKILPAKYTTPCAFELHSLFSLMVMAGCEYCVMEVSSIALSQKRVDGIRFHRAVFTNITQEHLDFHETMEDYREAKKSLFYMCDKAILNADDDSFSYMSENLTCEILTYSIKSNEADFIAKGIHLSQNNTEYQLLHDSDISRVTMKMLGEFNVCNALAVGTTAFSVGMEFEKTAQSLCLCEGLKGRMEIVQTDKPYTVIIDYAHTPDALLNVLKTINKIKQGRSICLFGCGGDRDCEKRPLMGEIAADNADVVIITSDNPRSEEPQKIIDDIIKGIPKDAEAEIHSITNRREAIEFALTQASENDIILLAGKGHETYQITGDNTVHFDEREIVRQVISNKL